MGAKGINTPKKQRVWGRCVGSGGPAGCHAGEEECDKKPEIQSEKQ